ncbi:MAG TPA: hypothetical protein VGW35_04010 [Methylomirabilota bacterium]|nr:hypothetical protein [Methylomirabilota bacterium]
MTPSAAPAVLRFTAETYARLRLYVELCPSEIGGLGEVRPEGEGLLVTELFLLDQRVSAAETELQPEALLGLLHRCLDEGRDPAALRLWWHSHAEHGVEWSDTDEATIRGFGGDSLVSLVTNKAGDLRCRYDTWKPERSTVDGIPVVRPEEPLGPARAAALRKATWADMVEKISVVSCVRYPSPIEGQAFELTFLSRLEESRQAVNQSPSRSGGAAAPPQVD